MKNQQESLVGRLRHSEIWTAYDVIERRHGKTPLLPFGIAHQDGFTVRVYAKMDTQNPGGSFKDRGSMYFIYKAILSGDLVPGDVVVTASAGNHAKGVAKSAKDYGLKAVIYMPKKTPEQKIIGTEALGAEVRLVDGNYHDAEENAKKFADKRNLRYVHAYKDPDIIIGQSSVVTETMVQLFMMGIRPDAFIFPFGGGGLSNGGGFAARRFDETGEFLVDGYGSRIFTYGVQAENFNTMVRSFNARNLLDWIDRGDTIADGIKVPRASQAMLELSTGNIEYKGNLDGMCDVSENQIRGAIRRVHNSDLHSVFESYLRAMERLEPSGNHRKTQNGINIIEGAAAAAFAAVFAENKIPFEDIARCIYPRKNMAIVVVASGNNIDKKLLDEILAESD